MKPVSRWEIRSAGGLLAILATMNFLNYVDRQITSPLGPILLAPVKNGGLGLSKGQVGLLATAFMIVHSLSSLPLGYLADRYSRKWVIAAGVGIWSLATGVAGLAQSFAQLFTARAAVGIGEAAYAPAATAMISERFRPAARARAMGIFQVGTSLGGAAAVVIGGWIGGKFGWRAAFLVVGGPGLLLTGLILLVRERPRRRVRPDERPSGSLAIEAGAPASVSALVWINITGILITFFVGAFIQWGPTFILNYHYGGDLKKLGRVTTPFGLIGLFCSAAGVMAGSFLADRLEKRYPGAGRLFTIAFGVVAAVPCAVVGVISPNVWLLYFALGAGVFFAIWYLGPILAALHDVLPPHRRATATGAYFLMVHLLGDAVSPPIVGFVADHNAGSLRIGLLVAIGVLALACPAAILAIPGSRAVARMK